MSRSVEAFTRHRSLLVGVAYRILGSAADAEDVVQESWLRWSKVDASTVAEPRAYLITTVSRLAIDRLRRLKAQREAYVGPWLPEPVATTDMERSETVELAMLVVLETLSPLERAVFVLREAFELPYSEIAEVIGREEATTRQIAKRAREHVRERRRRFDVDKRKRREITEQFMNAVVQGDVEGLTRLLATDVSLVSDSGGKARSPLRVVQGASRVARGVAAFAEERNRRSFLASLGLPPATEIDIDVREINGGPALVISAGQRPLTVVSLIISEGVIDSIYLIVNPDKLSFVGA